MRSVKFLIIMSLLLICGSMFIAGIAFAEDKYTFIGVTHGPVTEPFHIKIRKGFEDACALFPEEVKGIWMGPEKYSVEAYLEFIDTAIEMNPDAIFCTMNATESIEESLRAAIDKGIAVMAFNVSDTRPEKERIPYLTYVGANSYEEGATLAREAFKQAKFEITGAFTLNSHPGHPAQAQRIKGFGDVCRAEGIPVYEMMGGKVDAAEFSELCLSYVKANPKTNLTFTTFSYQYEIDIPNFVKEGYKPGVDGDIIVLGTDNSEILFSYLKDGLTPFLIDQQPYYQGYMPVVLTYNYLKYGLIPPRTVDTGPALLTMSNYDMYMKWAAEMIR